MPQVLVTVYDIVVVPIAIADKTPDEEPIVAMDVLVLTHVPPPVVLVNVDTEPTDTINAPAIAGTTGAVFTVTDEVVAAILLPQAFAAVSV